MVLLYIRLRFALKTLGLNPDIDLRLKEYSKKFYGYYKVSKNFIVLFVKEESGKFLPYNQILKTLIHEYIHMLQWQNREERYKGIMHDAEFKSLYNKYIKMAEERGLIKC